LVVFILGLYIVNSTVETLTTQNITATNAKVCKFNFRATLDYFISYQKSINVEIHSPTPHLALI